jgi:CubicO group peptidase (beta-lactamase class C family)
MNGDRSLAKSEFVNLVAHMRAARPFRESFVYSTWNYCLIQIIAEKVTGKPFGDIMKEKILMPLGLSHSTFEVPTGDNVMVPHGTRDNGSVVGNIPVAKSDSEQGLSAVMGGKMSLGDSLIFYAALLKVYHH